MRSISILIIAVLVGLFVVSSVTPSSASDYNAKFMRNYPPGYHGMWYKAERFWQPKDPEDPAQERYRWDLFMSRITGVIYPFLPVPYAWDYGTGKKFNLPDYNSNDWF